MLTFVEFYFRKRLVSSQTESTKHEEENVKASLHPSTPREDLFRKMVR